MAAADQTVPVRDAPAAPRRPGTRRAGWRVLIPIAKALFWVVGLLAVLWLLGYVAAAPVQRWVAPLPDQMRVRRTQIMAGRSMYTAESIPARVPLPGYRVVDELRPGIVYPLSRPADPPFERLLLVPDAGVFTVTYDMNSWWDLRGGDWSYVEAGSETAPDGTVWTIYDRVER